MGAVRPNDEQPAPTLSDAELHLIGEGNELRLYDKLGAQLREVQGVHGTAFAVWAPNAKRVSVVGDFNDWDGRRHVMRRLGDSGVWEVFVPEVGQGAHYKFELINAQDRLLLKTDPMGRFFEKAPKSAAIVWDTGGFSWSDDAWLEQRAKQNALELPMSIYEVHLGSWRKHNDAESYSYRELADELVGYVREMGFTHVEFMPVAEHAYYPSWGYQVTGFYAPTNRYGTPDDFAALVDALHAAGIGVILDWVPAHFPRDDFALAQFDGTALYEHADPRRGEHPDWGTLVFNFGRAEVRNFLTANALYWCERFHVDGLRVDAVASMLYLDYSRKDGEWSPNKHGGRENLEAVQFLQEMNATVYRRVPGVVTIAEESTSWPGVTKPTDADGLGFGFKWNMGWMHDSLTYMAHEPVHRAYHHGEMTFSLVYAWSENFVLPISHDEVVHGKGSLLRKMPGDRWQQLANLRAYLAFMWGHPGKQLLFMGAELGQESEWAESRELDWWLLDHPEHAGVHRLVRDLNRVYGESGALWAQDHSPDGFAWIDANDAGRNVFSFVRRAPGHPDVVCVANFSAVPHHGVRVGFPASGEWAEVLNTDAEAYTGSGVGNFGAVTAGEGEHHGHPAHAELSLPPLGTVWFRAAP